MWLYQLNAWVIIVVFVFQIIQGHVQWCSFDLLQVQQLNSLVMDGKTEPLKCLLFNNHAMIHVLQYLSIIEQIKDRIEAVALNFLQIFYVCSILHLFLSFNYSLYQRGLCQLFIINCPWRYGGKPPLSYLEVQNQLLIFNREQINKCEGLFHLVTNGKDCSGSYCTVWSHHHWSLCWNPRNSH